MVCCKDNVKISLYLTRADAKSGMMWRTVNQLSFAILSAAKNLAPRVSCLKYAHQARICARDEILRFAQNDKGWWVR